MKRILAAFLVTGLLSGCASLPGWLQLGGPDTGFGNKTVSAKEAPATLVALDGTLCTAPAKYRDAKVGDRVWCYWRVRGHGPGPEAARPGRD